MVSQELRDSLFIPQDSRTNFKQIIAKRSDLVKFAGGRMKYATSGTLLYNAGLVVGLATSGPDNGFYKPYAVGNTDGSQVAAGVLSEDVITDTLGNGSEAAIIRGKGITVFKDVLIGLDSNAITNLGAVAYVEHGVNLLDF